MLPMPRTVFWIYVCASLVLQARLAATLVGLTMFVFVLVMDLPAVAANPHNRFFWALALRRRCLVRRRLFAFQFTDLQKRDQ